MCLARSWSVVLSVHRRRAPGSSLLLGSGVSVGGRWVVTDPLAEGEPRHSAVVEPATAAGATAKVLSAGRPSSHDLSPSGARQGQGSETKGELPMNRRQILAVCVLAAATVWLVAGTSFFGAR